MLTLQLQRPLAPQKAKVELSMQLRPEQHDALPIEQVWPAPRHCDA